MPFTEENSNDDCGRSKKSKTIDRLVRFLRKEKILVLRRFILMSALFLIANKRFLTYFNYLFEMYSILMKKRTLNLHQTQIQT